MSRRRVVVTGLGIVSPVGIGAENAWSRILAGESGITRISRFDASGLASQIAGEVKDFDVSKYLPAKEARRMDRFIHLGLAAAIEAIADSGLQVTPENAEPMIEDTHLEYMKTGPRRISPFFVPGTIINMVSGHLSIMYGLKGPNLAVVTACTTAAHSIGEAGRLIEYGDADVMVAGGAESPISRIGIAGFNAARALSTGFNETPEKASRPYDKDRDGFVMG